MQRSLDELGTPLHDVTFVVVDLETTGGSPVECGITEIGAVKLRGGECLGTFQTLVNPGSPIPPAITVLTGITEAMVMPAPRIEQVLPSLLEFVGGAVVVGHNIRFDLGFLAAALGRAGYGPIRNRSVDTCALARRLVRDEVPNCRLGTLAERLRLPHRPTHRALDDALATGDLLHLLLERAGRLGVLGLDDLLQLPTIGGHPQANKLRLTARLPRLPGVYLFRDRTGRVLYVGKATNLRARVRSYFSGDDRRKIGQLLREVHVIDHIVCASTLEAAVLEIRLIHEHVPRFNRQSKLWSRYAYVKVTLDERFPRLSVVKKPRAGDGCLYLGPVASHAYARRVVEAIETAAPLRRCTARVTEGARSAPCAPAQLGVGTCPCAGAIGEADYAAIVEQVVRGLTTDPRLLLAPLGVRMQALAASERFEEAADMRDRAAALAATLRRQRRLDGVRRSGRLLVEVAGGGGVELDGGRLVRTWADGAVEQQGTLALDGREAPDDQTASDGRAGRHDDIPAPLARHLVDELAAVAAWLDAHAARTRIVSCDGELASALPPVPRFEPVERRPDRDPALTRA